MSILLLSIFFGLLIDALCWLAIGLEMKRWPRSRPVVAWPFIWFKRQALKPRGRWM
jgi:hypothetical protein